MSNSQPIQAGAPPGAAAAKDGALATPDALAAQLRQLMGMLGVVAGAIDEAGDAGLCGEERELVDAILQDARHTIVAIGALLECSNQELVRARP